MWGWLSSLFGRKQNGDSAEQGDIAEQSTLFLGETEETFGASDENHNDSGRLFDPVVSAAQASELRWEARDKRKSREIASASLVVLSATSSAGDATGKPQAEAMPGADERLAGADHQGLEPIKAGWPADVDIHEGETHQQSTPQGNSGPQAGASSVLAAAPASTDLPGGDEDEAYTRYFSRRHDLDVEISRGNAEALNRDPDAGTTPIMESEQQKADPLGTYAGSPAPRDEVAEDLTTYFNGGLRDDVGGPMLTTDRGDGEMAGQGEQPQSNAGDGGKVDGTGENDADPGSADEESADAALAVTGLLVTAESHGAVGEEKIAEMSGGNEAQRPLGWLVVTRGPNIGSGFPITNAFTEIACGARGIHKGSSGGSNEPVAAMIHFDVVNTAFSVFPGPAGPVTLNGAPLMGRAALTSQARLGFAGMEVIFVALCGPAFRWGD